jgi:1,4-alpha-glucan branching enzyme
MMATEATTAALADPDAVAAVVGARHADPFSILGPHRVDGRQVVRAFLPQATRAWVIDPNNGKPLAEMQRLHADGFYACAVSKLGPKGYRLRLETAAGPIEQDDPYRFGPVLGELDTHLIRQGDHRRVFDLLGCHAKKLDGVAGLSFAVWAPGARRVSLVGAFNGWDGRRHPMRNRADCGVWEIFLPDLAPGTPYKYEIVGGAGHLLPLKTDPFAFATEHPPATAALAQPPPQHGWQDDKWMAARASTADRGAPISIYEVHLGSWMRGGSDGRRYLSYAELSQKLVPYAREMGFTHIEMLPVAEHPFDGSWGYQPIGLYAPTSRLGPPQDFAAFVDACHRAGIGVLVDWVPGHFPTDAHGLGQFDGTHLYEHADPRQGFHPDWNTLIYNYGRAEVSNFLLANALYWLEHYHIDGLRVDAVASMLYLDYSRAAGEWIPNVHGGNENLEAIEFLKRLNELTRESFPTALTVAEESTAWPGVSRPTEQGGLGFNFKWNMGWMHDTLRYMAHDPIHRRYHHNDITFGLVYAFSENFVLPLSHDEVVHGKGSLLGKMPGDRWQKLANLRAYYGLMFGHPGKKLLFMGGEFAQDREWNHDRSLDWHLLDDPAHKGVQRLVRDLNRVYRETPALHERDCDGEGFEWIEEHDAQNSVFAFLRRGSDPDRVAVVVSNFTPIPRHGYRIGVPLSGWYAEAVNTDSATYGGTDTGNAGGVMAEPVEAQGRPYSLGLTLPPLSTLVLVRAA